MTVAPQYLLRRMSPADLDAVLHIEHETDAHPWTISMFADGINGGYDCWVAEQQRAVIGYAILSIGVDEAHILKIAVTPSCQQRGVGRALLQKLITRAEEKNVDMVFLEVRQSNNVAQRLYTTAGFNQIGLRKLYYPGTHGREDAIIFALQILKE